MNEARLGGGFWEEVSRSRCPGALFSDVVHRVRCSRLAGLLASKETNLCVEDTDVPATAAVRAFLPAIIHACKM